MTIRGRSLESAVGLACISYRRANRADIFHRATPMRRRADGTHYYAQKAGVDWNGLVAGGRAFAADTKETANESLPLANIHDHQVQALRRTHGLGGVAGLIVSFMPSWETHWIPFEALSAFLSAPWRQSLSRDWCRAFGMHVRIGASANGKPMVLFLDHAPYHDRANALTRVEADRLANPLDLELEAAPRQRAEKPLTGKGSPFDLLEIAKRARRKGVKAKKWSER